MIPQLSLQIIYKVGGTISCLGSGYIIQDVLRNPDKRSKSIYHRIMLGLSTMDIFFTFFAFVLGSWPMPKGSFPWAVGSIASCDVVAFIVAVGQLGSPLYNCSLASFYSLQLKCNWTDRKMKKAEKWFHIVPCAFAFLFCVVALCTKSLGPTPSGLCGLTYIDYPYGCGSNPEVECTRNGTKLNRILTWTAYSWPSICILYISITMFRVYRTVRNVEVNAEKYSFVASFRAHKLDKKKSRKRSRRVMTQGILYSAAMVLTWGFTFIFAMIVVFTNKINLVMNMIALVFNPLQGAFNFLIYLMPVFRRMLKKHKHQKSLLLKEKVLQKNEGNSMKSVMFPYELPSSRETSTPISGLEDSWNSMKTMNTVPIEEEKEEEKQEIDSIRPSFCSEINMYCEDEEEFLSENQNNKVESDSSRSSDDNSNDHHV